MGKQVEKIEGYALNKTKHSQAQISRVGVVGAGVIGCRLTLAMASKDVEIVLLDLSEKRLDNAIKLIGENIDKKIQRWGMTAGDKRAILSRITLTTDYKDFKDCDMVIESIMAKDRDTGILERKLIFKHIEEVVREDAIIATNSTTMVITSLSEDIKHKERCLGIHFMSAVPGANIVEISAGLYTSQQVCDDVSTFIKLIGRTPVIVDESPGFISVRLTVSLIGEACSTLMEGVASKKSIDLTMKRGLGLTLGPFELADKIGIDRIVRWMDNLYIEFGTQNYKPSPLLKKMVRSNKLGRKTGKGFYDYDEKGNKIIA